MIATMKSGISKIRNPVIARVFRELDLVEQWGSGVRRIFEHAAAEHLPEPEIQEIGMRLRFTVRLDQPIAIERSIQSGLESAQVTAQVGKQVGEQVSEQVGEQVSEQVGEQVSEQVATLLRACAAGPKSKRELLDLAGLSDAYLNYKRHILPLLNQEFLERTIPEKPNSRLQKYRLTAKGRKWIGEGGL
jgi:ATP-dependent DNA helicase RecG